MNAGCLKRLIVAVMLLSAAWADRAQSGAYSNAIISLNPAGYWPMHEVEPAAPGDIETNYGTLGLQGTGYYPDWAGPNGNIIQRGFQSALAGDSDSSIFFNQKNSNGGGATNALFVAHISPLSTLNPPFSVECWVFPRTNNGCQGDVWSQSGYEGLNAGNSGGGSGNVCGIRLYWNSPGFVVYFYDNGSTLNASSILKNGITTNEWYHVVVTCDAATNIDLYANGVLALTVAAAGLYSPDYWTPFEVGNGRGNTRAFPQGGVDELAIYTNALSALAISNHYAAGMNSPPAQSYFQTVTNDNPVIYLRMDNSTYSAPPASSWPALMNYGQTNGALVGNGVYTPGTMPGNLSGMAANLFPTGLSSAQVAQFSGVSGFADAGHAAVYNPIGEIPFSVTALFRGGPCDGRYQDIVGHSDNSWRIAMNSNGHLQAQLGNNATSTLNSSGLYNDGNWHQAVLVYAPNADPSADGTDYLYVDGVLDTENTTVSTAGISPGSSTDVMIAAAPDYTNNQAGLGRQFAGQVCEAVFFTNALTVAQIQNLYSNCEAAPYITTQPAGVSTLGGGPGTSASLAITANGAGLAYQWYFNTVSNYSGATPLTDNLTNYAGSSSAILTLTNLLEADSGYYFAVVTNDYGSATSVLASLMVEIAPYVTNNLPAQVTIAQGQLYTYQMGAIGTVPLTYQWYENGALLPGATNATYSFTAESISTNTYLAAITNDYGSTTSISSTLIVPPSTPMTLNITNTPGYAIPADFIGMGFEAESVAGGEFFNATNLPLITLFQNLGVHSLRIGGGTSDGPSASIPDNSDISNLFAFAHSVGNLNIIYSLQLHNGNSANDAAIAQYVWTNYASNLTAFALGNEPDWSSAQTQDPTITNFTSYLSRWGLFADAITNVLPGTVFAGPDTGGDFNEGAPDNSNGTWANNGTEWTTGFAADENSSGIVKLITQHEYVADGSTIGTAASYLGSMLSPGWDTVTNQVLYNVMAVPVLNDGLPYRFTEAEDCVGGIPGASDTFAGALWSLDYMHWWAAHDCAGMNFHNSRWRTNTVLTVNNNSKGVLSIYPKGYGVKAFDEGGHGDVIPVGINNTNNLNLTAYAVCDGTNVYVTLINREYGLSARDAAVGISLNDFPAGNLSVMYMISPGGVAATNGTTLGGASITNNAPWLGQWTELGTVTNGQCTVAVPFTSAVIVKIGPAPIPLNLEPEGAGQFQLSWSYGTLQSATNVIGPYNDVPDAASPFSISISATNAQKFYRVREN